MEVMGLQATYRPGRRNKLCTTITVEQDVECMCGCNVKPSDCGQNQVSIFIRRAGGMGYEPRTLGQIRNFSV